MTVIIRRVRQFANQMAGWIALSALSLCLWGCGGGGGTSDGGGGGGGGGNSPQDFTLSVSPSSVTVTGGGNTTFTATVIAVNGFASTVSLSISSLPSGVTISPANPQVTPGTPLLITVAAAASVSASSSNLTVTGMSGSLTHTTPLGLTVNAEVVSPSLSRTRYVRTDMATEYPFSLNSSWIVFNSNTKRFFVSDPEGNQIVVMDATKQTRIASIPVPGAFGIDETSDGTVLYAGTQVGDVYAIDPVGMTVKQRYPASQIGPYGYQGDVVRVLSSGKLALLEGQGGVDGNGGFAIWNPVDNSITMYGDVGIYEGIPSLPNCVSNIGAFTLTGDRSLIVEGSILSDGTLCTVDPATGLENEVVARAFLYMVAPTPDGKSLLVPDYTSGGTILVYDAKTLTQTSSFPVVADTSSAASMIVSADSTTLYIYGGGIVYAYNIASGSLVGWTPYLTVEPISGGGAVGSVYGPQMQAIDGTGLIAGPMEEGVGFIDTSALRKGRVGTSFLNAYLSPATGPASGGTVEQWSGDGSNLTTPSAVYFGANTATNVSQAGGMFEATTPAGPAGPVDVYTLLQDGSEQIVPEGFSYGPTIIEATPNASTSEGGGTGILYGYGFGSTAYNASIPTGLTITVGGMPATVTGYSGNAFGLASPPFLLEAVAYTIPPGVAGSSADIEITSQSGSTTLAGGMQYLPAATKYPLPGASLAQGIYDSKRNVYYFTDAAQIRVFSRAEGQWLNSIAVPAAPAGENHNLWGIALSPDGSKLAVSDPGDGMIYLIDPDTPTSVQSFLMPASCDAGSCSSSSSGVVSYPAGLAVSNAGTVYTAAFPSSSGGYNGYLKLNTGSGAFTDYSVEAFNNAMSRNAISSDNARVFFNNGGEPFSVDTATDTVYYAQIAPGCCHGDYDLNLSNDQTSLVATSYLYDADLNAASYLTLNDRESLNTAYVYGVKLSPDGSLLFQPSIAGIDVFDGRIGTLRTRIALPYALSENYDALVSDGTDNVLIAITGATGDGIAVLDLTSVSEPAPLPYTRETARLPDVLRDKAKKEPAVIPSQIRDGSTSKFGIPLSRIPHAASTIPLRTRK